MVKVKLSKYCDFCFGVKRAVRIIEENLGKSKEPIYSFGPFIHNPQVVGKFSKKGLKIIPVLKNIKAKTLVVRTHGISPAMAKKVKEQGIKILDATCPNVKKVQKIVRGLARENYKVIIVGDKTHPEVKSLVGQAKEKAVVINRLQAVKRMKLNGNKIGVVAQTTQSKDKYFKVLSHLLKKNFSQIKIYNTICEDVLRRQKEVRELACNVEVMLVVGGKISANTRRLAEICRNTGTPTYHIESGSQVKSEWLRRKKSCGIASGASTPHWIVSETVKRIKNNNLKRKRW